MLDYSKDNLDECKENASSSVELGKIYHRSAS